MSDRTNATKGDGDIHILALVKGDDRYFWLWRDSEKREVIRRIGRAASNPELSISWQDSAHLANRISELAIKKPSRIR